MNINIFERVRIMLSHAKLPKIFWGEAIMVAVDLINLSFPTLLNGNVVNNFWTRNNASYNHFEGVEL